MAICIDGNFVCLAGGCFCQTPTGIEFSGQAGATKFCDLSPIAQGTVSGYASGGGIPETNIIDKFPFAADASATDIANLTQARRNVTGQSSLVSGYTSGGTDGPTGVNTIDKFPFASDDNATDVGNLTQGRQDVAGQSSRLSGYTAGGFIPAFPSPLTYNTIDKFPFSSDSNATDVGNLSVARYGAVGQSSSTFGYSSGGFCSTTLNTIDKFPFSSDSNATDVGELTHK
jgi:hypothetical protein